MTMLGQQYIYMIIIIINNNALGVIKIIIITNITKDWVLTGQASRPNGGLKSKAVSFDPFHPPQPTEVPKPKAETAKQGRTHIYRYYMYI
jgi:hypothetical protein